MPRTTVAVEESVARRISALARRFNLVISSFSTEALGVAGDLLEMGLLPRDLKKLTVALKIASFLDPVVLPMDLFESLVKKASACGDQCVEELTKEMEEWGRRVASVVKSYYEDNLESLLDAVSKASKIFALREIAVEKISHEAMEVKIVGVGKSELTTRLTYMFIKNFFQTLGYNVKPDGLGVGIIRILLEKGGSRGR